MPSPNILILMTDQHSKYHLGCYDDKVVRTPNLDALAARGVTLDNAYCASPVCVPSRMSFMTGRRPSTNEVWNNNHVLRSDIPTWAHALGASGYETSLIGRMHFLGPDQRHGFERRPLGEYGARHPGASRQGGVLLDKLSGTAGQDRRSVEVAGRGRTTYQAFDDAVTEATCSFLQDKGANRAIDRLPPSPVLSSPTALSRHRTTSSTTTTTAWMFHSRTSENVRASHRPSRSSNSCEASILRWTKSASVWRAPLTSVCANILTERRVRSSPR